jgi:hypothetical protein
MLGVGVGRSRRAGRRRARSSTSLAEGLDGAASRRRGRASQGGADVVEVDGVALGEEEDFADDVLQLAHVAGPAFGVDRKSTASAWMDGIGDAELGGVFAQEVFYQVRDVFALRCAQRRASWMTTTLRR